MDHVVQDETDDDNESDDVNDGVHCTLQFKLVTKTVWMFMLKNAAADEQHRMLEAQYQQQQRQYEAQRQEYQDRLQSSQDERERR